MHQNQSKKIAVGLSGGVDSAVSAYLLKQAGHEVTGVYIQCWDSKADGCTAEEDRKYAVETCTHLGIKFIYIDLISEYKSKVIEYFYAEYLAGRTPNPDVMCNKEIKFGLFYDWAFSYGFDSIATGHYARIERDSWLNREIVLKKGKDSSKDQSYFLYRLSRDRLENIVFPVGGMIKKQVRKIAEEQNLPPAKRSESMGICFIGEVDVKEFLSKRIEPKAGDVVDSTGKVVGTHSGAWFYTIGQRHGFTLTRYVGVPMYVISKDVGANTVTVGTEAEAMSQNFEVGDVHWIGKVPSTAKFSCDVRIRHLGKLYRCSVFDHSRVELAEKVFGIAPGQSAVFYQGDTVLGGGIIL